MAKTIGIILIAIGLAGIAWGGLTYTTRETVVDLGPIQATREKSHSIPLPPVAGAVPVSVDESSIAAAKRANPQKAAFLC